MRRNRVKTTGKGKDHSFVMIPRFVLQSHQFTHLDPYAKALFMYWAGCYNGFNNGDFAAPNNRYKEAGFKSPDTLKKAKVILIEEKFAVLTRQGQKRKPSLFGLTIWSIDECGGKLECRAEKVPSNAWRENSDGRQPSHRGTPHVLKLVKKAA